MNCKWCDMKQYFKPDSLSPLEDLLENGKLKQKKLCKIFLEHEMCFQNVHHVRQMMIYLESIIKISWNMKYLITEIATLLLTSPLLVWNLPLPLTLATPLSLATP